MPARNNRGLAPGFAEAYRMFEREQLPVRLGEPGKHIYALRQLEARQESAQRRGPRAFADLLQKAAPHIHALGDKWVELCDKDSDNPLPGKQVIADLGLVSSNTKMIKEVVGWATQIRPDQKELLRAIVEAIAPWPSEFRWVEEIRFSEEDNRPVGSGQYWPEIDYR